MGILVYCVMEEKKRVYVRESQLVLLLLALRAHSKGHPLIFSHFDLVDTVDDGSSQLIEITEKLFVPRFNLNSKKNEPMFIPPPPRFKNGETLRVTGALKHEFGRVTVGLAREEDIGQYLEGSEGWGRKGRPS